MFNISDYLTGRTLWTLFKWVVHFFFSDINVIIVCKSGEWRGRKTGLPQRVSEVLMVYRAYAHDREHMHMHMHMTSRQPLVFQNNETVAMLVYQTNPVGVQLFSYVNTFFCSNKFAWVLDTWLHTLYRCLITGLFAIILNVINHFKHNLCLLL